jgi:hypothetical protein
VAVGAGIAVAGGFRLTPVSHSDPWLRLRSPLIEPDVRFPRIRLSDEIHDKAHAGAPTCNVRSRWTPSAPKIRSSGNRRVPRRCRTR